MSFGTPGRRARASGTKGAGWTSRRSRRAVERPNSGDSDEPVTKSPAAPIAVRELGPAYDAPDPEPEPARPPVSRGAVGHVDRPHMHADVAVRGKRAHLDAGRVGDNGCITAAVPCGAMMAFNWCSM